MFRSNATSTAASRASRVVTKIKFMPFAVRHFSSFVFLYFVGRHQSSIRWQFHTHSANANIFECVLEYAYFCVVHVARVYCVHDEFTYRDVDTNWLNWRIRYNNSAGEAESVQVYANASTPIPPSSAAEHSTSIAYGRMEQLNNLITRSEYLYARRDGLSLASVVIVVVPAVAGDATDFGRRFADKSLFSSSPSPSLKRYSSFRQCIVSEALTQIVTELINCTVNGF